MKRRPRCALIALATLLRLLGAYADWGHLLPVVQLLLSAPTSQQEPVTQRSRRQGQTRLTGEELDDLAKRYQDGQPAKPPPLSRSLNCKITCTYLEIPFERARRIPAI